MTIANLTQLVIETRDNPDIEPVRDRLGRALPGVDLEVSPLFRTIDDDLARFFLLSLPRVDLPAPGESPFDLAHHLIDELYLASAEPVLEDADPESAAPAGDEGPVPSDVEWHIKRLRAPRAWEYSAAQRRPSGGLGTIIAQVDTGVAEHRLLDGAIDWDRGRNLSEPGTPPVDPLNYRLGNPGHGTSAAGVAASRGRGGATNVRGAAPASMIAPMRAVNSVIITSNNQAWVARGVDAAIEVGAHVISMSLGGPREWPALKTAIRKAVDNGIIVIAAAGNYVGSVTYPGWDENCIAVAASTPDDKPWPSSCRGKEVAVTAPGANIQVAWREVTTDPVDKVGPSSGTSWAAASVGGLAALWLSHHGRDALIQRYGRAQLHHRFKALLRSTADTPPGWDVVNFGTGIADAERLLKADLATAISGDAVSPDEPPRRQRVLSALREMSIDGATIAALSGAELDRYAGEILHLSRSGAGRAPFSRRLAASLHTRSRDPGR